MDAELIGEITERFEQSVARFERAVRELTATLAENKSQIVGCENCSGRGQTSRGVCPGCKGVGKVRL